MFDSTAARRREIARLDAARRRLWKQLCVFFDDREDAVRALRAARVAGDPRRVRLAQRALRRIEHDSDLVGREYDRVNQKLITMNGGRR